MLILTWAESVGEAQYGSYLGTLKMNENEMYTCTNEQCYFYKSLQSLQVVFLN